MAANGGTALRNLDKFRNRTKKINTVTPQPNYSIANLPKSQNEMVHFLEKLAQEMAVQKDTDSRIQSLRKLCDLVYLLVQLHQQNHMWRQHSPSNNEDKSEQALEEDVKDQLDGEQLWNAFLNNAKILRSAINFAVTDDKVSIVAKEACETMVTLATLIKDELAEPLAEHLVGSLWKASNGNVSGVSEVAVKALRTFIQYVQHTRLVKAVLNLFTNQSMTLPMSRNLASEFVGNILIYQKITDVQPHLEEIEKIIAIGLKDSSSTIKTTYRKNFWLLAKAMPEQVQEWVNKMDTIDWRSVQEARPAEAPSLSFGCSISQKQGKTNEQPHSVANTTGVRNTMTRKTTNVKKVDERDGNNLRKGKIERSQPTNATVSKTSLHNVSSSGADTKEKTLELRKTKPSTRVTEKATAVSKSNTRALRTTVHTISSSAKRISNDRRNESDSTPQKLSVRRKQEKDKQHKGSNSDAKEQPETLEDEEVLNVEQDIVETPKEEKVTEPPILLLSEPHISEVALTEVIEKFQTLLDVNTKTQIIQTVESFVDNAMKDIEKEKLNILTNNGSDSHWIKKDEDDEGTVDILHFVPLVLDIIANYLQDENEKLVVPAMKAFTKLLQIFSFQELRQHNRKLEKGYNDLEETLRKNSILLQKIFEKSGDSNGFIASTATTVLEQFERAIPFFPLLMDLINQSCLRQCYNNDLPVKVILQALVYLKAAIQKNRKQENSYFRENVADNLNVVSLIGSLVKDVGPHAEGKSAELRRAACDVFMELEEVPSVVLEQVAIQTDEGKHLHLLQRLGLISSSVTATREKSDVETPSFTNNNKNDNHRREDELQDQSNDTKFPSRKASCEVNLDTSDLPKTKNEEVLNTENDKGTTNLSTKMSKATKPVIPLEDTFQSQFEALKEKWMRNKEQNESESKQETEAIENIKTVQEHTEVVVSAMEVQKAKVIDSDADGEALDTHLATDTSNVTKGEQMHVDEKKTLNSETDNATSTIRMDQTTESSTTLSAAEPLSLPSLRSDQLFIKNIAHKLCTVNREDEKECSTILTEIREQLQIEDNVLGISEIYDLLTMFLLFSREKISSVETNYLLDMEFLWQMNFRELWKRSASMDCLEALDLFCWEVDNHSNNLSRFDSFLQAPNKTFEMKMLFQGMEHALKVLEQPLESITTLQQEQIERLKPAISNALLRETCLEIKQAAYKCVQETKDRLRDKQESLPFLDWCRELNLTVV
ncbi:hypothetical protein GpartN1_g2045.t1 [Galdieria partita]|uniref:CLASP N-terminal domain-containing protein n=1 Tax=Galdieria partita TaxID=83374 RepID=A0A9C7UNV1_9RHOD|nr:hypothetical protein GpartN1_g2045.t1 [Galdieria partita]